MRPIRVAHVVSSLGTGGLEKGIATLISNGSESFEHSIVCLTKSGGSERLLPQKTNLLELNKAPGNSVRFIWRLATVLKSLQPDVIHTRNWSALDGVLAARVAKNKNIVHGEHGWGVQDLDGQNFKRVLIRRMISKMVREYVCVSKHMIEWLRNTIKISKPITQIYNGVDTDYFSPGHGCKIQNELNVPTDSFVIGTVSRLDPVKDHPTLLKSFHNLRKINDKCILLIVGDGKEFPRIKSLAGEGVFFLGNRCDINEILKAMDVFVLPSLNEGISNTILEAMATGLPVIATNVGGNPELVLHDQNGFLVSPQDEEALTYAMKMYQDNPQLCIRHGKAGRQRALKDFSIRSMVESYESVWKRVVGL